MGKETVAASLWDKVCAAGFKDPKKEPKAKQRRKKKKKRGPTRDELEEAKPDVSYTPVCCKQCKEEMFHLVSVVVKCPMGWKDLTKNGLRYKEVQVVGAKWEDTQWFCGCETVNPRKAKDTATYKAGQRWTKGLVPKELVARMKNTSPVPRKRKRKKKHA